MKNKKNSKKKSWSRTKSMSVGAGITASLFGLVVLAGFMGTIDYHGVVGTAYVEFEVVDFSETWVYKDLETGGVVISDHHLNDPNLYYVAHSWAEPGQSDWDVDFYFENIFPCIDFKADFVAHYIGSIPVHLVDVVFNADPWLQPYITWLAWHVEPDPAGAGWIKTEPLLTNDQLHYCDYFWVEVIVHLPQDNDLQGLVGEFSGQLEVLQWSDLCGKVVNLPTESVTSEATYPGSNSYFSVELTDVPEGDYNVVNGTYLAWCVDIDTAMVYDPICVTLWSSYDLSNPYPDPDWDMVNYIINHKNTSATISDIQNAIWHYIDGGYGGSDPEVLSMIAEAELYGEGYVPGAGEWVAVIQEICPEENLDPQWIFLEVDP